MLRSYYFERITHHLNHPFTMFYSTSPRKILFAANLILAVSSFGLTFFSLLLLYYLYSEESATGYINWLGLAVIGLSLLTFSIVGMRGAHIVSIELLLAYFWGVIVCVAPLLLGLFSCFNFFVNLQVWIDHEWQQESFANFRELFCPTGTHTGKCVAPLVRNVTDWCVTNFGAVDCAQIRATAIEDAITVGGTVILTQSIIGLVNTFIIAMSVYICHEILTSPVITQSMNDVINYFLILPIAGMGALSAYLWYILRLELDYQWMPYVFLSLGVSQLIALPFGIVSGRLKSRNLLSAYMVFVVIVIGGKVVVGVLCLQFSAYVEVLYSPSVEEQNIIACEANLAGCSYCNRPIPESAMTELNCPEWSQSDTKSVLFFQLRLASVVCFISTLYLLGALIVAGLVRDNLKNYKSDFI